MAEVYTAFHTRRDVTVTLKSGDSPVKSYALKLHSGESITVGDIKCYVIDFTARCDNKNSQYIALGAKVWAAKN